MEKNIQELIDNLKNGRLTEADKEYLIELLKKDKKSAFVSRFLKISRLAADLARISGFDVDDLNSD